MILKLKDYINTLGQKHSNIIHVIRSFQIIDILKSTENEFIIHKEEIKL